MRKCKTPKKSAVPFAALFLFYELLSCFCIPARAQISPVTPNDNITLANYLQFEVPTATDARQFRVGRAPLVFQLVVTTSPVPQLHWDYGGMKGALNITGFGSNTVFLDDVLLLRSENTGSMVALISCREIAGATTNIWLVPATWNGGTFSFTQLTGSHILLGSRASSTDWFDAVRISTFSGGSQTAQDRQEVGAVWQQGGRILVNDGYYYFATNTMTFFRSQADAFPQLTTGTFKHPDISRRTTSIENTIIAIRQVGLTQTINSTTYGLDEFTTIYYHDNNPLTLGTVSKPAGEFRTPRVEKAWKPYFMATVNLLDHANKKSYIMAGTDDASVPVITVNQALESACSNNTNYLYTGFPAITIASNGGDGSPSPSFEIAWQQIQCNGTDFCNISAISKRYDYYVVSLNTPSHVDVQLSNQYLHINADLTRNSVFPGIVSLPNTCLTLYSFGIMDKTTSLNGGLVIKNTSCNGTAIRAGVKEPAGDAPLTETPQLTTEEMSKAGLAATNRFAVYPNPARDILYLEMMESKETYTASVYNSSGGLVKRSGILAGRKSAMNIQELTAGTYYIKVTSKNGENFIRKIVIVH
jgi:hypothetical protein